MNLLMTMLNVRGNNIKKKSWVWFHIWKMKLDAWEIVGQDPTMIRDTYPLLVYTVTREEATKPFRDVQAGLPGDDHHHILLYYPSLSYFWTVQRDSESRRIKYKSEEANSDGSVEGVTFLAKLNGQRWEDENIVKFKEAKVGSFIGFSYP